jgi:hypothetical protein
MGSNGKGEGTRASARFTGRSSSQSIGFGSIFNTGSGNVSLAQTMGNPPRSTPGRKNFAESPVGKIGMIVASQLLVLLITKIIFG